MHMTGQTDITIRLVDIEMMQAAGFSAVFADFDGVGKDECRLRLITPGQEKRIAKGGKP